MKQYKTRPGEKHGAWAKQGLGGYPGLTHTARQIVEYIPRKFFYVEPFAGLGRTAKYIESEGMILNDKSEYAYNYLVKHFPRAGIYKLDFMECIDMFDSPNTDFFIDPPWTTSVYKENDITFCDRKDMEYYSQLFTRFHTIKGDWIIASSLNSKTGDYMRKESLERDYPMKVIESRRKLIIGKRARTLLMSNKPFIKHRPVSVGMESFL